MIGRGFTRWAALLASTALLAAAPAAAQEPGDRPTVVTGQVETEALRGLDLWSASGGRTGLTADLWDGASLGLAELVVPVLGTRPLPPSLAELARRTLATGARAPAGAGQDPDLAAARALALIRLGDPRAAFDILSRTPGIQDSAALSRARSEAALWLGEDAAACETADNLRADRGDAWQLKLRALCDLIAGQEARAQITLDLWRQRDEDDAAFTRLFARAQAAPPAPAAPAGEAEAVAADPAVIEDALTFALSRRLGLAMPVDLDDAPAPARTVLSGEAPAPAATAPAAEPAALAALIEAGGAAQGAERARLQARGLLTAALGTGMSPGVRALYATFDVPAPRTTTARLTAMDMAADAGHPGETALFALSIAHQQPQGLTVADRAAIARALYRVGFEAEASALVAEGLAGLE